MSVQPQRSALARQQATRAAFFIPGFAIAAWAPLVPFAKLRAGLDDAGLGLVLLSLGAGSLLSMPMAGAFVAWRGYRSVLVISLLLICAALPLLALVNSFWLLGVSLFVLGIGMGSMDCAMNMQAIVVEREAGRAMMSGFHGFYSIGGLIGAASATALLSAGVAAWLMCLLIVAIILVLAAVSSAHWLGDRTSQNTPVFAWPRGSVALIGVLCFISFLAEGAMLDWSAVFLHEVRGVESASAGLGYVLFSSTMTAMRLLGDRLVQRIGRPRSLVLGSAVACIGLLIAALAPVSQIALCGYALVGLGCANIVPVLFSVAGQQRAMPEALAIPAVTTLGYAGVLAGPAIIGFVSQATSLVAAFIAVGIALSSIAIATRWLDFGRAD